MKLKPYKNAYKTSDGSCIYRFLQKLMTHFCLGTDYNINFIGKDEITQNCPMLNERGQFGIFA